MSTAADISVIRGAEHVCMYDEPAKVRVFRVKEVENSEEKKGAFEYMDAADLVLFWIEIMLLVYIFCFVLSLMIIVIYKNSGEKGYVCKSKCSFEMSTCSKAQL